jgi:tetratricopeptide (TPR) repeat protein
MLGRRRGLRSEALLAALLALGSARIGRADDPRGEARAHYAKGLELAAQNGYEGALREFNAAYAISPQFAVLFNIGQAHIALGHTVEAIEALTRYLNDGGDRIAPTRRAQVERQIAGLRSTLPNPELPSEAEAARATAAAAGAAAGEATEAASEGSRAVGTRPGTLTVRCPEPGLKLVLDGKRIDLAASSRGVALPGGVHHLVLSAPGRRSTEESLEIEEGGAALVICENLPLATAPPAIVPLQPIGAPVFTPVTSNSETPTIHAKTVVYLLGGLGVALGGTAIGVYFWNRGQYQDAQREQEYLQTHPTDTDRAIKYNADVDALNRNSIITVGLAVTSIGLLAGGAYLYLYERKSDAKTGNKTGNKTGLVDLSRSWASVTPGGVFWNGVW